MQAAFKQRWKGCLVILCIALAFLLVYAVFTSTNYFSNWNGFSTVLDILMVLLGGAVLMGSILLSLRFSYQGRRYGAVVFSSVFGVVMLAMAVTNVRQYIPNISFSYTNGIQALINTVQYVCVGLIAIDFYVFSHIAPRYNGSACGVIALALAIVQTLCALGVFVWDLILLSYADFGRIALREAASLLSLLALPLMLFSVAMGMLPVRRARRKPAKTESPMFPALENYREKLRKERA